MNEINASSEQRVKFFASEINKKNRDREKSSKCKTLFDGSSAFSLLLVIFNGLYF